MTTTREAAVLEMAQRMKPGAPDERMQQADVVLSLLEKVFRNEAVRLMAERDTAKL